MRFTCYFDANKQVVAGGPEGSILSFTVPAGVYFVRITVYHDYTDIAQLEVGTVATVYESYRYQMVAADGVPIYSATDSVVTDYSYITISAKQYVPYGKEIALYGENLVKDYPSYRGRIGISFTGGKETGPATKIIPASGQVNTTIAATATVANPAFATLSAANFSIVVTDPTKTTAANIQNLGDSYTGGMAWANVILGTAAAAGLTFSGNRDANSAAVMCEGQGGWHLSHYFTVDAGGYLSPFMQPVIAGYKYYGQTAFWVDANAATPTYNAEFFTSIKTQFNATTGRKVSPAVNDVMGDGGGYIVWNGSAWVTITSETFGGFAFSYAKYRAAWSIPAPTIFHVLLGTNDFFGATEATFAATYAAYKANYDTLIASVKADTPAVKIIVGIPVSSGRQGKWGTLTTERVKRAMWLLANSLNADYGGREAESIYVLDYHSVVDRFYGFNQVAEAPFADYTGAAGDGLYKSDITHLSPDGFEQMGNAYMGLIQFLR